LPAEVKPFIILNRGSRLWNTGKTKKKSEERIGIDGAGPLWEFLNNFEKEQVFTLQKRKLDFRAASWKKQNELP